MKTGVIILFGIAFVIAWAFAFAISCLGQTYSFTAFSATVFAINFIPICFLVHQKTIWQDFDIHLLFKYIATKIPNSRDSEQIKSDIETANKTATTEFNMAPAAMVPDEH